MWQAVTDGLWVWRIEHPDWAAGGGWQRVVTSTAAESGDEVAFINPLEPPSEEDELWARFDARPPTMVVVLKPDHVRDVDVFVRRYGARASAPTCSFARTFRTPSSSRSTPEASYRVASSRFMTGGQK